MAQAAGDEARPGQHRRCCAARWARKRQATVSCATSICSLWMMHAYTFNKNINIVKLSNFHASPLPVPPRANRLPIVSIAGRSYVWRAMQRC